MSTAVEDKLVKDHMHRDVFVANLEQTYRDAGRKMHSKHMHHMVIVDEEHRPVSVISSFEFIDLAIADRGPKPDDKIGEHAPRKVYSINLNEPLAMAANLMNTHHVNALVVIDDDKKLAGIITPRNIMNAMFDEELEME